MLTNRPQTQQGAVLIVSLVMLMVMTVLGVSTMRSAAVEEKISANAMNQDRTFRAAESATEWALGDQATMGQALLLGEDNPVATIVNLDSHSIDSSADTTYIGEGLPFGFSLGESSSGFSSFRFELTGRGAIAAVKAQTTTQQGAARIGPGSQ